jgi:tetratricopeptide (TPR) repeat protein
LFLHQCGESSLWLHLLSKPDEVSAAKAMAMIRKSLEKLAAPALFCFDDADLLLPDELNDTEPHQSLRALLEDFAESPRNGSPLLFIGQRLLMAPERGKVFQVDRFTTEHTRQMLTQAGFSLDGATIDAILHYTRGNPLLLHLLIVLQQLGESAMSQPALLSATASLDWFVARLLRHLSDREHEVMEAISAFDTPAPASLWRKQHKAVEHLSQLGLIERDTAGDLMLLPALREAIYRQLSAEARETHHLAAAQGCAELGAFTLAARHYVQGRRPEMAIWLWHAHRDEEIRQGQAQTALGLFLPLQVAPLSNEQDRRALALILADLNHLAGKHEAGLVALEATSWPAKGAQSAHAHALKAKLLAMQGDVERAVQSYRAGVRELEHALPAEPVTLRVEMARQMLTRMRDVAQSRQEALLAKHDVELLLGEIDEEAGNVDAAHSKYMTALEAARVSNDPVRLAKACEMLGILESRRQNVVAAQRYLAEAGEHYQAYGNIVCAAGMTKSNIAFAYMMAGQHDKAVVPLREAISFYEGMNQPYHLALNLANLSEVMIHLNDAEQAEQLAWRALSYEEAVVRPLCLYVLGEARRRQRQFQEAERMCKDAIDSADTNSDPWSAAYAWRVLGDVYRDWARPAEAQGAYTHARDLFEQFGLQEDAARMNAHMSTLSTAAGAST